MIIDLKKIRAKGKDSESFYFEYLPTADLIAQDIYEITSVKVTGQTFLTGLHSAVIEGEVCFTVKGQCTRCLTPTEQIFSVDFSESADNEEEGAYPLINDKIDLTKIADDLVIMNLPVTFLCKEDCKGLCTGCGVNLNECACKCEK